MKTLYLHIGTTKTATTSIQRFLEENKDVLQKHGYCFPDSLHVYPRANKRRNAHFLVAKVWDADGNRNQSKEKEYFEEGLQQIRTAFGAYDHVILTDESIWHALSYSKKTLLQELKKEADEQKYQIKVIVYLRRQDGLLISRWNQEVKQKFTSAAVMTCEEYLAASEKKEKKIYQYAQKLDEIAAVIGKNNLIVRRFSPKSWKDGSIIHDFMHEIGLDVTEKFQELERTFERSVKCITDCDAAAFREECRQAIRCLQELYPELQDFRREFYKHLCVLSDVLIESQKQVERGSLVSFQEMAKCQSIEAVQAYGESVLSDISKHLTADQTGSKHRVILELLTYLDEHYDQDIGLSELADRAGMSTAYLSVLFKTEVGTSYVKYLTDLRIKKAKKLLQDGYKVNEVSEMVGYNNYRYFCDIFKKHEGMTPNEYKGNVWKAE